MEAKTRQKCKLSTLKCLEETNINFSTDLIKYILFLRQLHVHLISRLNSDANVLVKFREKCSKRVKKV